MMTLTSDRYFPEINLLRGVAILGVISIHVSGVFTDMDMVPLSILYMSIDSFSHFAVPLFIFVSGFVLYNKYSADFSLSDFYKKRFLSVIPQYLFFSIIALVLLYFTASFFDRSINLDIAQVSYRLLTGKSIHHLWFVILIIQLYILYPLIIRIYNVAKKKDMIVALLMIAFLIQVVYSFIATQELGIARDLTLFLGYILYFFVGMYARSDNDRQDSIVLSLKTQVSVFVVLLSNTILGIIAYSQSFFDYYLWNPESFVQGVFLLINLTLSPVAYLLIFFIFLIASRYVVSRDSGIRPWLDLLGTLSFGIYLVHPFVLYGLELPLKKIGYTGYYPSYFPVIFLIALLSSVIIILIIKRFPHHQWIIGR